MQIAISTLGCKLNQAESDSLARKLAARGHTIVPETFPHDVFVLNTCTVTSVADAKSRHALSLQSRRFPEARLVATGCYAEREPDRLRAFPGVALVVGNRDKADIADLLTKHGVIIDADRPSNTPNGLKTRAFLKIQEGCDNRCSYCVVPQVRGSARSLPLENVLSELIQLDASGYREVVVTGTEIGSYRHESTGLPGLIAKILGESAIPRIRISSLQPNEITDELLRLWNDERLCPHFHISLQSGSDPVLAAMRRRYQINGFEESVRRIRATVPDATITTDIIVGFPGETDDDFQRTVDACMRIGFSRIHFFPFSPRPGTPAASLRSRITPTQRASRLSKMKLISQESNYAFAQSHAGRALPVLWEQRLPGGVWSGLTSDYLRVYAAAEDDLTNRILPARIDSAFRDGVRGTIV